MSWLELLYTIVPPMKSKKQNCMLQIVPPTHKKTIIWPWNSSRAQKFGILKKNINTENLHPFKIVAKR